MSSPVRFPDAPLVRVSPAWWVVPGIGALVLAVVTSRTSLDLTIADALYARQGHAWALRDAWITERLLHQGGRAASAIAWLAVLAVAMAVRPPRFDAALRPALLRLAIAVASSTLLVSLAKAGSPVDCPWDLQRFGGEHAYVPLLSGSLHGRGGCFPAGHASAGYAWVAGWFTASRLAPRWRWPVLLVALGAGAAFGFAQQLRGAHFLSHDLATLGLCWLVAVTVHMGQWIMRGAAR